MLRHCVAELWPCCGRADVVACGSGSVDLLSAALSAAAAIEAHIPAQWCIDGKSAAALHVCTCVSVPSLLTSLCCEYTRACTSGAGVCEVPWHQQLGHLVGAKVGMSCSQPHSTATSIEDLARLLPDWLLIITDVARPTSLDRVQLLMQTHPRGRVLAVALGDCM